MFTLHHIAPWFIFLLNCALYTTASSRIKKNSISEPQEPGKKYPFALISQHLFPSHPLLGFSKIQGVAKRKIGEAKEVTKFQLIWAVFGGKFESSRIFMRVFFKLWEYLAKILGPLLIWSSALFIINVLIASLHKSALDQTKAQTSDRFGWWGADSTCE